MKINKTILGWVITLCLLAGIIYVGFQCYEIAYTAYANEPLGTDKEKVIELVVEEGNNYADVATKLEEEGLLDSTLPFMLRSTFSEYRSGLKPGTYAIPETMGIDDILVVVTQSDAD